MTTSQDLYEHIHQRKRAVMLLSMGTALTMCIVKIVIAQLTGSVAVLSEAVHSLTDLIAATIVWYSLQHSSSPPDSRHRYGHEKVEDFAAIAEGFIILAAVSYVFYRAIDSVSHNDIVEMPGIAVIVMLVSALINGAVALRLRHVARETESPAVEADGQHLYADVVTSLIVAAGMAVIALTGWQIVDPIVAIVVTVWVGLIGIRMIVGSTRTLLDEALPPDELDALEAVLAKFEGIASYHRLRTRRSGSRRHVDLHLTMDSNLPLWKAHTLAHSVEAAIASVLNNADVLTHIEPLSEEPPPGYDAGPSD